MVGYSDFSADDSLRGILESEAGIDKILMTREMKERVVLFTHGDYAETAAQLEAMDKLKHLLDTEIMPGTAERLSLRATLTTLRTAHCYEVFEHK